jgi:hypothetical protein
MDSLTTAYLVCMLIGSGCAVGGAFAGNKIFPVESSEKEAIPLTSKLPTSPPKVETPPPPKPVDIPALKSKISAGFGGADDVADLIVLFLQTPVKDWKTISEDFSSLTKKFRQTMTHPNLNKCPQNLLKVCDIVSKKYSNMKDYNQGNAFTELGNQTSEAAQLLENTVQTQPAVSSEAQ